MIGLNLMATINECSKYTGLSYHAIRMLVIGEKIKFIRSGNKIFVNTNSLLRYLGEETETQLNTV